MNSLSPGKEQKSLRVRFLEWFLVLYALHVSRVVYLGYRLYVTRGTLNMNWSGDAYDWIYYFIRKASALGILGYILFRNSRWCRTGPAHSLVSENGLSKTLEGQTLNRDSHRLPAFELLLVLFVAFASSIFNSFSILVGHETLPDDPRESIQNVYEMLSFAGAIGLLGCVLSRSSRVFRDLGLRWTSRGVAVALPLALAASVGYRVMLPVMMSGAEILTGDKPNLPDMTGLFLGTSLSMGPVLIQFANGFCEELIVRGYLMTEVRRFTGSSLFAIICSVTVQVSYHFYQGGPPALALAAWFLVFAVYYAKTDRLLPVVLAHIALDLYWVVTAGLRLT